MLRSARIETRTATPAVVLKKEKTFPAPLAGWSSDASIALENEGAAEVLENFIPTTRGVRVRGGSRKFASVGLRAIESLMVYRSATDEKLFAAMNGSVYDVSAVATPTTDVAPAFTGQTSNDYSYVNFSTAGGNFMLIANGTDLHRVYNGTAWATNTPAITGVSSADITQMWTHAERIWMVEKDSKTAWYLSVDTIGGAASSFSLAGVFRKGGKLLFGATWSQDSGSGSDDRCVFVSDKGEAVVYGGDYPGGTWRKFGRYDIPRPLGKHAFQSVGGDLLILTVEGIVPVSEVTQKDPAALSTTAITKPISPDWKKLAFAKSDKPWRFLKWDEKGIGIVAIPTNTQTVSSTSVWGETFIWGVTPWGSYTLESAVETPVCFVVNLQTGRWSKVTGWDGRSMAVYKGDFVFGTSSGTLHYGDTTGNDDGKPYECRLAYWPSRFDHLGEKQFHQAAAVFEHSTSFNPRLTIATNNLLNWASAPSPPVNDNSGAVWDTALWDQAVWDTTGTKRVSYRKWVSLGRRGRVGAILLQLTFNNSTTPDVEFTDVTVTYEPGGIVV